MCVVLTMTPLRVLRVVESSFFKSLEQQPKITDAALSDAPMMKLVVSPVS